MEADLLSVHARVEGFLLGLKPLQPQSGFYFKNLNKTYPEFTGASKAVFEVFGHLVENDPHLLRKMLNRVFTHNPLFTLLKHANPLVKAGTDAVDEINKASLCFENLFFIEPVLAFANVRSPSQVRDKLRKRNEILKFCENPLFGTYCMSGAERNKVRDMRNAHIHIANLSWDGIIREYNEETGHYQDIMSLFDAAAVARKLNSIYSWAANCLIYCFIAYPTILLEHVIQGGSHLVANQDRLEGLTAMIQSMAPSLFKKNEAQFSQGTATNQTNHLSEVLQKKDLASELSEDVLTPRNLCRLIFSLKPLLSDVQTFFEDRLTRTDIISPLEKIAYTGITNFFRDKMFNPKNLSGSEFRKLMRPFMCDSWDELLVKHEKINPFTGAEWKADIRKPINELRRAYIEAMIALKDVGKDTLL